MTPISWQRSGVPARDFLRSLSGRVSPLLSFSALGSPGSGCSSTGSSHLIKAAVKNRKPKTASCQPSFKVGKRRKFPGNDCYIFDKEEEYRLLELEKKISQLDLAALTRGLPPAAALAKEEAILDEIYNSIPIPKDKPLSEYLHEQSLKN